MNPDVIEITENIQQEVCQYCQRTEVNSLEWGPLYQLDGVTIHYFCMLFSAGLSQNGEDDQGILGFLPVDIKKELNRGNKLKCKFCKHTRATIGCSLKNCKVSYHYPCGLENGCGFQFIGNYESYCAHHTEPINIPLLPEEWDCPICMSRVDENPLWPPCCKKKVFHKECILNMALTSGVHFFKCPLCNDKDVFSVAMRKAGVYCPDRDALWEMSNQYEDHLRVYSKCDADECMCPLGRDHNQDEKSDAKSNRWKVIRCGSCAAAGIHIRCGNLKNLTWRCPTCAEILYSNRQRNLNESIINASRIQRHQYDLSSDDENDETPVIGIKEVITEVPEVENESVPTEIAGTSERQPVRRVYDRWHRRYVYEDVSDEDSGSDSDGGSESSDSPDEIFIQPNAKLSQKIEALKNKNSSSSATSNGHSTKSTDKVSNSVPSNSPSPSSFQPVERDKLIKRDSRKNVQRQVTPVPQPEVIGGSAREVKISLRSPSISKVKSRQAASCSKKSVKATSGDDNEPSVMVLPNETEDCNADESCIILDDDDDSSSDLEIVGENIISKPVTKSSAILRLLKDKGKDRRPQVTAFVSKPAGNLPPISDAFLYHIKEKSRLTLNGRLSSFMRNRININTGPARKAEAETIELISDDEDAPESSNTGESEAKLCSRKKRDRMTDQSQSHAEKSSASKKPRR